MKFRHGMKVQVIGCSGIDSGKTGVVDPSVVSSLSGYEQSLVFTRNWIPIRLDNGDVTSMTPKRLISLGRGKLVTRRTNHVR